MWETGVQQTCVIITSVQAACHIWHRGAENRRRTAQKTKKSARLQSFVGFSARICPPRMTSALMPRHWRTSSGQNRKGRGHNSRPCPSKCRKAKATVSFDQSVATVGESESSQDGLKRRTENVSYWRAGNMDEPQSSEIKSELGCVQTAGKSN